MPDCLQVGRRLDENSANIYRPMTLFNQKIPSLENHNLISMYHLVNTLLWHIEKCVHVIKRVSCIIISHRKKFNTKLQKLIQELTLKCKQFLLYRHGKDGLLFITYEQ